MVSIGRGIHVTREGLSLPWVISSLETIDGIEYVDLSRRDTGLHRFITHGTDLTCINWPFEQLKSLRNRQLSGTEQAEAAGGSIFKKELSQHSKRKLRCKEKSKHEQFAYLLLDLPAVAYQGEEAGPISFKVKRVQDLKMNCAIEVSVLSLTYLRLASLAHAESEAAEADPPKKRSRVVSGLGVSKKLSWLSGKQVFLASR
eukprot:1421240-Amphidinium_carterae.1